MSGKSSEWMFCLQNLLTGVPHLQNRKYFISIMAKRGWYRRVFVNNLLMKFCQNLSWASDYPLTQLFDPKVQTFLRYVFEKHYYDWLLSGLASIDLLALLQAKNSPRILHFAQANNERMVGGAQLCKSSEGAEKDRNRSSPGQTVIKLFITFKGNLSHVCPLPKFYRQVQGELAGFNRKRVQSSNLTSGLILWAQPVIQSQK